MEWFSDTASETLKRPSSVVSSIFSRKHRSPAEKSYLPTVSLVALCSVLLASVGGLAVSGLAFASPQALGHGDSDRVGNGPGGHDDGDDDDGDGDRVRAQCFVQSLVLFSSILSTIYTTLHLFASRKGDSLFSAHYWRALSREDEYGRKGGRLTPSSKAHHFLHPLHAWTIIVARIAFLGWGFALLMAAVAATKKRGPGKKVQADTVSISLDVFFSAIALPAILLSMTIIERASQPFVLPWPLSPCSHDFLSCRVSALGAYLDRSVSQRDERQVPQQRGCREIPAPAGPRPMIATSRRAKEEQAAAAEAAASNNQGRGGTGPCELACELACELRGGDNDGLLGRWMPSWGSAWGSGWGSPWGDGMLGNMGQEGEGFANQQQGLRPQHQHQHQHQQEHCYQQQHQAHQQCGQHHHQRSFSSSQYSYPSPRASPEAPAQSPMLRAPAPVVYPSGIQTARSMKIVKNPRVTAPSTVRLPPRRPVRDASVVSPHPRTAPHPQNQPSSSGHYTAAPIPPPHSSFPAPSPAPTQPPHQYRHRNPQPQPQPHPLSLRHPPAAQPLLPTSRPRNLSCPPDASTRVGPSPLRFVQSSRESAPPRPPNLARSRRSSSTSGSGSWPGSIARRPLGGCESARSASSPSRGREAGGQACRMTGQQGQSLGTGVVERAAWAEGRMAAAASAACHGEETRTRRVPGAYVEECTDEED